MEAQRTGRKGRPGKEARDGQERLLGHWAFRLWTYPPPKWEDVFEHYRLSSDAARRDETEWAIGHPGPFGALPAAENGPRRLNNTTIYQHLRE